MLSSPLVQIVPTISIAAFVQHLDHGVVHYVAASLDRFAVPVKTNPDQWLGSTNGFPSQWNALQTIPHPRQRFGAPNSTPHAS
jgi:acyl carrier protein phosphodiesterase